MGGAAGDQRPLAAAMSLTATGRPTREGNAMGRSTEDWQSYRLGERIIHTPAVHGAGWLALGWQRLNCLDAPMPPAEAREKALAGEVGAVSVSEAMQNAQAEPSMLMPATEAMAAAVEEPTAGSADGMDRGLSKSALLAAARELEQAEHGSVAR